MDSIEYEEEKVIPFENHKNPQNFESIQHMSLKRDATLDSELNCS